MAGPGIFGRALNASWARWPFPPGELFSGRAEVVHGTNFVVPPSRRAAMVVSVHDLTPLHFPEWCRPAARAYPALVKKRSVGGRGCTPTLVSWPRRSPRCSVYRRSG